MDSEVVFRALGDRTRQRLLALLNLQELSVSELVSVLEQPQSTVSRHLRILREAGLIGDRREGATVMYHLATASTNTTKARSLVESNGPADHLPEAANGRDSQLTDRLVEWVGDQELPVALRARLGNVLESRGDRSRRFFDRIGRQWDSLREESFGPCFHLEAFFSLLPADWTVLDAGSGTGYLLPPLARRFARVIAVEPADNMRTIAQRRVQESGFNHVEFQSGELAELPLDNGSVDLALAVLVLHHVPSPSDALRELCRVLRGDGRLLLVEQQAHDNVAFRDRMQDQWWGFEPEPLSTMARMCGFVDIQSGPLTTVIRSDDAPQLFVMTARKN